MTTPARRTDVPQLQADGAVPVVAPLGWLLTLTGALFLAITSWTVYPDDAPGMWAGYRAMMIATPVLLAVMALRSTLPKAPSIAICGLGGALAIMFAIFLGGTDAVVISEFVCGVLMLVGALLQVGSARD